VVCASSAEKALPLLHRSSFDVVVTDIRMPGLSGMELLKEVKGLLPKTQVILMTGYRDLNSAIEAVNQGAFAYIEKPFDLRDLHERVLEALETKNRIEQAEEERKTLVNLVGEKERQISLLKERSQAILSIIPSLFLLVDQQGRIRDANEPFRDRFGEPDYGDDICGGLGCPRRTSEGPCEHLCELWRCFRQSVNSGSPSERFTITLPLAKTTEGMLPLTLQVRILPLPPLPEAEGSREYLIAMEDITRERAMEMQILQSSHLASLGEMASGIAHELSQPLNVISTQAQLLRLKLSKGDLPPQERLMAAMEEIVEQVFLMSDILQHLRVYNRRQVASEISEFSPMEWIEGSLRLIRSQLKAWGIELSIQQEGPDVLVRGRPHELQHALTNVLLNARDALRSKPLEDFSEGEKKEIRIRARSFLDNGDPWISLEVEDNGIGMPAAILDQVFNPLFTTKGQGEGTGVGLPIASSILQEHNGRIEIRSSPGKGTQVRLVLPALLQSSSNL